MDIVSIKKFLKPGPPKPDSYIRFLQQLLTGIAVHAVEASELELTRFRQEVSDISGQLSVHSTAEEIEVSLGFVIRAVTGYNRIAARITQAHVNELQAMLAMMSRTITFLSDSSKTGIEQLQAVEKNLHTASTIGDVRVLRSKLNDCLVLVRKESTRLRGESQSHITELQKSLEQTANHVRSVGVAPAVSPPVTVPLAADDELTGLPARDAAEQQIASNISQGKDSVVTLFLIDRFAQLDRRFGSSTGDEVSLLVSQHLRTQLETGSLFKWSRPSFISITRPGSSLQSIEQQMARIASKRFEKTMEEDRRMVLLPITCSHLVQKVSDLDSLEAVAEILDDFVATKST